jgi:hypothetical protein
MGQYVSPSSGLKMGQYVSPSSGLKMGQYVSPSLGLKMRQYVSPKRWHLPASLHDAKTHKNNKANQIKHLVPPTPSRLLFEQLKIKIYILYLADFASSFIRM